MEKIEPCQPFAQNGEIRSPSLRTRHRLRGDWSRFVEILEEGIAANAYSELHTTDDTDSTNNNRANVIT